MSETYEPGTPADIYYADTKVRGLRVPGGWSLETDWASFLRDEDVTDVRPLVVLDPDDREQMDALCKALVNAAYTEREFSLAHSGIHPDTVTTALRSLTKPPKPAEKASLIEFHADGRQYLVPDFARDKFLAAEHDTQRKMLAELIVEDGKVIKNRRGGVA